MSVYKHTDKWMRIIVNIFMRTIENSYLWLER